MKWEDVRLLVSVIHNGSISAAARAEKRSIATVARRIGRLEAELGVLLLLRGRDGVCATSEGAALVAASVKAEEAMDEVKRVALGLNVADSDPVAVSATEPVISSILAPRLAHLWRDHPGLRLRLHSSSDVVSLAAGDAALALRFARPAGDSLTVRRVATLRLGLFASADYLAGRLPQAIDPRRERLLGYDDSHGPIQEVKWFDANGLTEQLALRTSSTLALLSAAQSGAGIAILPAYFAARDAGLIEIPTTHPIPPRPVWLMSRRGAARRANVRAVRDWIIRVFASVG